MSVGDHQTLRVLEGRYVLERAGSDVEVIRHGEVLAVVRGPDRYVGGDRGAARGRQCACLGRGQL